jgi:U3 small nucleolar RNA-associated protein 11
LGHLGKGAAQRVQKAGWVEDEEAEEDRNGEKRTFRKDVWKWKLERRK